MSLPNSQDGKLLYINSRDLFNRMRRNVLQCSGGDTAALKAHVLDHLKLQAEFSQFRESVDFAIQEGLLTPGQVEAAQSAVAWGEELGRLLEAPGEATA